MRTGAEMTDTELVQAAANGDQQAFRLLVELLQPVVARTTFAMLGPGGEAEDAGQEAMVKLHQSLSAFRGRSSIATWMTRITVNVCLDHLRRRKRRRLMFWIPVEDADQALDQHLGTGDMDRQRSVHQALTRLTVAHRAVAVLRLVLGYSTAETAEILNIPAGTVLSRLSRAKAQLAEDLKDYAHDRT